MISNTYPNKVITIYRKICTSPKKIVIFVALAKNDSVVVIVGDKKLEKIELLHQKLNGTLLKHMPLPYF